MTFRQFAFNNVWRNKRTYAAFFFSSVFSVMIFFVYAMFIFHPGIESEKIHASVATGMVIAEYIIFLFAFFFLFYCVGAFLKKREKEFAILFVHGMTPLQRNLLIVLENLLIGAMAIVCGIGLGMVLAKLFFQFAGFLLDVQALPFYVPLKAIALTVVVFTLLFVAISVFTVLLLRNRSILELMQGSQRPKADPKASITLSVLATALLGISYILALTAEGVYVAVLLMPVGLMTVLGTYLMFTQLSVFLIGILKKRRVFYWRKTNLLTLSDMAYRMKDNARMFFLVSIVSTVAFCAIGTLASLAASIQETVLRINPYAFEYHSKRENPEQLQHLRLIESQLESSGMSFDRHEVMIRVLPEEVGDERIGVVKLSVYNTYARAAGKEKIEIGEQEAFVFLKWFGDEFAPERLIVGGSSLAVKKDAAVLPLFSGLGFERLAVVPDPVYEQVRASREEIRYGYAIPAWKETMQISLFLEEEIGTLAEDERFYFKSRAPVYHSMKQMANTALFIGLFVGLLFFVAAASFLYFRLYTDLESDKRQYRAISKIGMSESELTRVVTIQIALLFFVPILVAIVHSVVAFVSLQSFLDLMFVGSVVKPTAIVLTSFVVVQTIYFWIIRNRYLFHLKRSLY
ncbi:FtsX-like permease family protein [Brevibacillus sp. TJ4]|uniref:FtsX-like permease family protein n=1 Tax=Brevibacillus sp. TJ4 TaxID=3234853 RepID=UPI003BA3A4C0